jgi:hypothetical protein
MKNTLLRACTEIFLFILTIDEELNTASGENFKFFIIGILLRTVTCELEIKPVVQLCVSFVSRITNGSSPGTNIKNSTVDQEFQWFLTTVIKVQNEHKMQRSEKCRTSINRLEELYHICENYYIGGNQIYVNTISK